MNISNVRSSLYDQAGNTQRLQQSQAADKTTSVSGSVKNVQSTFNSMLQNLSQSQQTSDNLLQQLAAGEDVDVHTLTIAAEQTDINFRIAMGIRDRLVEAYREVMRMNV
ncbi:MAG TPA: flagellar hook-basal body complex protein FliE [Anaerolineaceae bacterium]|nr:flagellar hook-basal body complex protein FliE [Anaerolineaceae bacterium]HPN52565.1 flagellar hook-basal body complex protein FliE [Anaerolineaceae bacterium]